MLLNEQITRFANNELIQPHPKACTPTNVAYLLSLNSGNFREVLQMLLQDSFVRSRLYQENKGVGFQDMVNIANRYFEEEDKVLTFLKWDKNPLLAPPYILGVMQLPKVIISSPAEQVSIDVAVAVESLVIEESAWKYPNGHAFTITEVGKEHVTYFDSYLGRLITVDLEALLNSMGQSGQAITIN